MDEVASPTRERSLDATAVKAHIDAVAARALGEEFADPQASPVLASGIGPLPDPPGQMLERLAEAHRHAGMGSDAGGRHSLVRRLVYRVLRPLTREQRTYNNAVLVTLDELTAHVLNMRWQFEQRLTAGQGLLASTEVLLEEARQEVRALDARVAELQAEVSDIARKQAGDRGQMTAHRARIDTLLTEARRRLPEPFDREQLTVIAGQHLTDPRFREFQAALDERFRDSHNVRAQLTEHLRHFAGMRDHGSPLLDLGTGRGEWLELLGEQHITACGVDRNEALVNDCANRGLDVRHGDIATHLHELPDDSVAGVTAFHVAEHLPIETLIDVVDHALRVIERGGVLLLETPNPTNIVVGSASFYLDPTHSRPLHPDFLQFLIEQRGFVDVTLHYLHPPDAPPFLAPRINGAEDPFLKRMVDHLNWSFFGPMDYAVSARKA